MTIQNIIDGIAEALFREFGSNYEIYTTKVEQGLQEPCFIIRCLNPTMDRHLGTMYHRTNQFTVQYISDENTESMYDMYSALERVFECLRTITVSGKPIHSKGLTAEPHDGMITVTVNYDGFVLEQIESESEMGGVTVETEAKGNI